MDTSPSPRVGQQLSSSSASKPNAAVEQQTLLERITSLDAAASTTEIEYISFVMRGHRVGHIERNLFNTVLKKDMAGEYKCPISFEFDGNTVALPAERYSTEEECTAALDMVADYFVCSSIIKKRHEDRYAVKSLELSPGRGKLLATIDRNLAPYFGIDSVGVHLLCYVNSGENISLWMAQRSKSKSSYPLKWDPTVAGGQPIGRTFRDNMIKEANEEAGISPEMARLARSVGCLMQMTSKSDGSCRKYSKYYVWDLEVDAIFVPHANDGEVEQFELWDVERLQHEVRYGARIRPAMRLVTTDFLMRHGIITPDNEPDYSEIHAAMHRERIVS